MKSASRLLQAAAFRCRIAPPRPAGLFREPLQNGMVDPRLDKTDAGMGSDKMEKWADDVLRFWFEELSEKDHFSGGEAVDKAIRDRFMALHSQLAAQQARDLATDADTALAAILVLDQFPRNAYRGTAEAFATDGLACALSHAAITKGFHHNVAHKRRMFVYMPLMHSETLADQDLCVSLFEEHGDDEALKYAVQHRDVIARFGRYPHRNAALGRPSTAEELAYLKDANRFGQ